MKYSLHLRTASPAYLRKADEIVIEYKDRKAIMDCAKKYPQAWLVLEIKPDTIWNFDEVKEAFILAKRKLTLCVPDIRDSRILQLHQEEIPYFWGYTVTNFWELKNIIELGVSEVRIGAPIFFESNKLQKFDIPKRLKVNMASEGYFPNADGTIGSWIRPEDIAFYEDTFDMIEFDECKDKQEEALFRIYAEQKKWPGRVDAIIRHITTEAYNRMIAPEFAIARKNCGQRCVAGGACRICYRLLNLANPDLIKEYKEAVLDKPQEEKNN